MDEKNTKISLCFSTIIQMINIKTPKEHTKNIDGGLFFVLLSI